MGRNYSVMTVDDSAGVLTLIATYLVGTDFQVIASARDGKTAVDKYKKLRPEVLLLDIVMPEQSGQDTLRQILAFDPNAVVAMVSSLGGREIVHECHALGAKGFLRKPFSKEDLLALLRQLTTKT